MKCLIYLSALLFLSACHPKGVELNTDIHSTKTSKHENVPGTRLFIIKPPGFEPSATGTGYAKGESSIIIFDLPNGSLAVNSAEFTKEAFESKGLKVLTFGPAKVNGWQGKYAHMRGGNEDSYGLVFGDSSFCTLIMGVCKTSDHKTRDDLLAAINSVFYDKQQKLDPLKSALFSVDDPESKFKVSTLTPDFFVFTLNNENAGQPQGASVLYAVQAALNNTLEDFVNGTIADAQKNGLTNPKITDTSSVSINGYKTYKGYVDGIFNGKPNHNYFCSLTNGRIIVLFQGTSTTNSLTEFHEFDKLVQTIRFK